MLNKHLLNRAMLRLAGRKHWYASVIEHTGRRSHKTYATPVVADRVDDGFIVPLPYGTGVDWLRNVLAANRATVTARAKPTRWWSLNSSTRQPRCRWCHPSADGCGVWQRLGIEQYVRLIASQRPTPPAADSGHTADGLPGGCVMTGRGLLGKIDRLANGLWYIHGEMPEHAGKAPDFCNVVIYRTGDRLYMIDSGGGAAVRASTRRVLDEVGPVDSFTLINTHAHLDHICNNDLITQVQAATKHHYLLSGAINPAHLDAPGYFAEQFDQMEAVYDPLSSYQTERTKYRIVGVLRDALGVVFGHKRVMRWLFAIQLRRFGPVGDSRKTMEAIDDQPSQRIDIAGVVWQGWRLGDGDVAMLDARSHSGCDVLVYIEHRLLCMGDTTFPLFPTWSDSSRDRTLDVLRRSLAMTRAGRIALLADGHGDRCYRGQAEIATLLGSLLDDHMAYEEALTEIFSTADGFTPGEVYERFRRLPDRPVVGKYLELEYPHSPPSLQNVMVTTMRQLGYRASGPRRHQRFLRPNVNG